MSLPTVVVGEGAESGEGKANSEGMVKGMGQAGGDPPGPSNGGCTSTTAAATMSPIARPLLICMILRCDKHHNRLPQLQPDPHALSPEQNSPFDSAE